MGNSLHHNIKHLNTVTGSALQGNSKRDLKKLGNSAIPSLGVNPRKWTTGSRPDPCTAMFMETVVTTAKLEEQPKGPSSDEMDQ